MIDGKRLRRSFDRAAATLPCMERQPSARKRRRGSVIPPCCRAATGSRRQGQLWKRPACQLARSGDVICACRSIETVQHRVLDMAPDQDRAGNRKGTSAEHPPILRNLSLTLLQKA